MTFFGAHYIEIAETVHAGRDGAQVVATIETRLGSSAAQADVLDIGCGYGRVAIPLASRVHSVLGIDRSPELIEEAQRRAADSPITAACEFIVADASTMDGGAAFDVVLMLDSVLGGGTDLDAALLQSAHSSLHPGGRLFVSSLNLSAVLRHLDAAGRAKFALETSDGSVIDEVTYHVDDSSVHTSRLYEDSGRQDSLVVHLWDAASWIRYICSFGFENATVTAVDGSSVQLDTPELLIEARRTDR